MQSQLPPGIEKLVRIEPQQLKSEQQLSQPSQSASHVPARAGQQQLPHMTMPLAQWQVVRMLYAPQSLHKESHYPTSQQRESPTLQFPAERGVLTARFELEGQMHQVRWQVSQGEAVVIASSLANDQLIKLLPSVNGGWRIVTQGVDMADPLQLLWNQKTIFTHKENESRYSLNWLKWTVIALTVTMAILLSLL
ncbi:hypothetical protein JCM19233_5332 [Vibrio astriarenae]|nr:hypothetical protein JCM19233_5332 [Vibrio sp. C7]